MRAVEHIVCGDYVLVMDGPLTVIEDGAVVVDGGLVVEAGGRREVLARYSSPHVAEGRGKAVLPGLVNTHTHAAMTLLRGMADDLPLMEWLEKHVWPAEEKWLAPEFIADGVALACAEMLKAGITLYNDMYFFEETAARTARDMGMRAVLGSGIVDFPTKVTSGADDCLRKAEEFLRNFGGDPMITPCVAPHAVYTCSPETLRKAKALADRYGSRVHIHLAETEGEVKDSKAKFGKGPVELLEEIGFLDERVLAAHCVWLSEGEIEVLARRGVSVSHCPESNLKLASGIAPVPAMLKAGVKVSLGTDGAASNNDLNILSEMSTAAKLHKAVSGDPTVLDARTVLLMATRWGAEALGLGGVCGSLEPGRAADITVMDLGRPHLTPLYNIYSQLVYSARASDVSAVMVGGRYVVSEGNLLTAREDEIMERAGAWARKVKAP
ncbi:MAG: amidohydrolase family protein [Thermodesulfovibrionales bacterium]